jgi:hypothetical protein
MSNYISTSNTKNGWYSFKFCTSRYSTLLLENPQLSTMSGRVFVFTKYKIPDSTEIDPYWNHVSLPTDSTVAILICKFLNILFQLISKNSSVARDDVCAPTLMIRNQGRTRGNETLVAGAFPISHTKCY